MKAKTLLFLSLNLAVFTALFATRLEAQIPQPLLYLSFEGADPLADKSLNATVVNTTNGILGTTAGAFPSSTSSTAGNFDGNAYLKIPGINTQTDLNSYTFSAWIKPNDLSDRYVFGQDSQGIHIGIRSGGKLHQAHWGADKNGATALAGYTGFTDDGWIHAAWTYDTDTKVGRIYLDGVLDMENADHNPPNLGNGLMIGRVNGGQDGNKFLGLMDDVAVWNSVLDSDAIAALADGAAPVDAADEDEDTLPDWWENKYANDLTTLNGLAGDFDEDGLTDYDEFENGTDPTEEDTDADGLEDNVETNTGSFASVSDTGTNPVKADTDGDGLNDGAEVLTHETNPHLRDTDGDGASDGAEITAGTDPLDEDSKPDVQLVQPSFPPILNAPADAGFEVNFNVPGLTMQENHYPGGVMAHNNTDQNWDRVVVNPVNWPPTRTMTAVQPYFDHGPGGFNTPGGGNLPYIDGGGDHFSIRVDGFVELEAGDYTIHLGADDTNYFLIDTPDGPRQTGHNCCPNNHVMTFNISIKSLCPFANLMVEEGGGDWGDVSITGPGFARVALGDVVGGSPPVYTIQLASTDEDEDGLVDWWENNYVGNLTDLTGDGIADFDEDGLSDLDEFEEYGSDPTEADTDNDGLSDSADVAAGASPTEADTDGDGLDDGAEVNDHGSDPAEFDTDGDGVGDGAEIAFNTDPNDAASKPDGLAELNTLSILPTGNYAFLSDGQIVNAYVENDGTNSWLLVGRGREGWTWDAAGQGSANSVSQGLGTPDAFVPASYGTDFINGLITGSNADLTGVEIRIKRASNPQGTAYEEGRWRPISESAWRWNFDTGMSVDYEVVATNGVQGGQLGLRNGGNTRDFELGGNDGDRIFTWPWGGHNNIMGFSFGNLVGNGANNATNFLWESGDENHACPYAEIYIRLENPGQVPGEDTDNDGIVDLVEEALVGNLDDLTAGDDDGDGLDSPDEISIGTDPTEADTDGDGLEDGAEVTAGSDPLDSDTDGDGLNDGAEVATHGTDPTKADTDGDGFSDGDELIAGTDPTDENSAPQLGEQVALGLIAYWPLDGDLTDLVGESDGTLMGGGVATYTTGQIGDGIDLDGIGQYIETPLVNEELFDFPEGNGFSVSAWFRVDDFNKAWQCLIAKGEGNRWRIHRRGGEQIITGNGGAADVSPGLTNVNDGQIHHIVLVSDPAGGAVRLYVDGQVEGTSGAPNLENNAQPMMIGENPDARNRTWSGLIDDIGIWNRPLTDDEIGYIYRGGEGNPIISPNDDDEDGLPDFWEKRFGLSSEDDGSIDPENGPDGDPDEDGLNNEDEYANRTDPTEEDTDGDGLNDGDEIAAGVDPLNTDSDGDGLTDGSEVAIHGTDPAEADTDGDTVGDGSEIAFDTDPNDPDSRPDGLAELNTLSILPTGNYAFIADGQLASAYVENDGTNSWLLVGRGREGWTWDAAGQGSANSVSQGLGTPDAFAPASYGTGFINGLITGSDADLTGVEIRIKRASNPEGTAYEEARWRPITESAWRWNFDTAMEVEYEVVATNGVQGGQLGLQNRNTRDGELGGNDGDRIFTWNWANHGVMGFSMGDQVRGGANNATNFHWENGDENHAIPYTEIYIRLENPGQVPGDDTDDDGIVDIVEEALVGNLDDLTAGDDDGDGLDSPDEISIHGTDPTEADTDGDGLEDGAEVTAGTNPASGDTDGDGLADGVETNTGVFAGASDTGTDPNSKDTDSDGFSDGDELDLGTNPVNPNDFPDSLLVYYDFEGEVGTTVTDKGDFGSDGTFSGAVALVAEGAPAGPSPGGSAQFTGGFINVAGIDMNAMIHNFGDGDYTMTCWIKPTDITGEKFIFGQTNQGVHNGIRNNSYLHQAHWGADTNGATQLAPYLAADADGWIHAAFVYEGAIDQGSIYLDGQQDWAGQKNAPNGGGNLIVGGRNNGDGTQYQGLIDEVAIWRSALSAEKILELAEGGSPLGGSRVPLSITDISANFSGVSPVVTISFNSKSGRIYAVDRTTDLLLWEELDDGVEGEVESTDYTDSFLPEDSKVMFYRVREVE